MNNDPKSSDTNARVVNLTEFRNRKSFSEESAQGRKPLFVSHTQGRVTGSPHLNESHAEESPDISERVRRIRASLDKINNLMDELKKMAQQEQR